MASIVDLLRSCSGETYKQGHVAQPHLLQHLPPLQRREQTAQRRRGRAAVRDQIVHLVLHQRLQRGQDDRQHAAALVAHQRRQLEAQRLAAAGRQNRQ